MPTIAAVDSSRTVATLTNVFTVAPVALSTSSVMNRATPERQYELIALLARHRGNDEAPARLYLRQLPRQ